MLRVIFYYKIPGDEFFIKKMEFETAIFVSCLQTSKVQNLWRSLGSFASTFRASETMRSAS